MIKVVTKYKEDVTEIKLKHKKSCTMEFLALIYRLMQEIKENDNMTNRKIYRLLREMEKENAH